MAKYIGQTNEKVVNGNDYSITTQDMVGKIYQPGKDSQGKWLDTEGTQDTRIMLWTQGLNNFYKVYTSVQELLLDWSIEGNFQFHSPRTKEGLSKMLSEV